VAAFKVLAASAWPGDFFSRKDEPPLRQRSKIPGFTEISMYPKLWAASGLPFPRLLERLIALGFERHRNRKACVERDR
jgi:D-alanine-D-alanine ligase